MIDECSGNKNQKQVFAAANTRALFLPFKTAQSQFMAINPANVIDLYINSTVWTGS
jgi:hypothetical protein